MSYEPEYDDMDRLLHEAFVSRPGRGGSPSLVDVRRRARRHQRRRVSGALGATAVLGVSGVAVLATRGGPEAGIAGDSASTTALPGVRNCLLQTTVPPTTWLVDFTAPVESIPTDAPQPTSTTVAWTVGATPFPAASTIAPDASYEPLTAPCVPPGQFRCVGNNGIDDQGYTYFEYCEPVLDHPTMTTITEFLPMVGTIEGIAITTTSIEVVPTTTFEGVAATTTDVATTTTS